MTVNICEEELKGEIASVLKNFKQGDELELRFGYYKDNYFKSSISYNRLKNIIDFFRKDKTYIESNTINTVLMYNNGIKKIINPDSSSIIIKKSKKNILDIKKLNTRLALNTEKFIDEYELKNVKYISKSRNRITFTSSLNSVKIDITIDSFLSGPYQNQCEIEFISIPSIDIIIRYINLINNIK